MRAALFLVVLLLVTSPAHAERPPVEDDGPDPMLVAGWLTGLVGLVGIGVGVGYAGHASSQWDDALALCPSKRGCSPEAVTLGQDAGTSADIGTGAITAGAVLVATGAAFMLVALLVMPSDPDPELGLRF